MHRLECAHVTFSISSALFSSLALYFCILLSSLSEVSSELTMSTSPDIRSAVFQDSLAHLDSCYVTPLVLTGLKSSSCPLTQHSHRQSSSRLRSLLLLSPHS